MKYFLAFFSVISAVVAQVLIKKASLSIPFEKKWISMILLSIAAYGITFLLQAYLMRLFPLSKIAPAAAMAIMVLVFICGVLLFGEIISSKQIVGVLLGVVSIYLILV